MSDDTLDKNETTDIPEKESDTNYKPASPADKAVKYQLSGMYQNWFLDYASYVILERAVPHINDGLKPVQRRILHAMKRLDDGRYNKVANIVGHTMQFHPHGDASIGDALVQLGQKDLLIDCQGNWGNILTGDDAAAPRYIEARLSKFALDVVFNPKTTEWQASYDGRNREPVTLPVKFPLLLAQGVEGIAVGLSSKILPHNFNELCDAAIAYLHGEEFHLYPDFQTGGAVDVSRYNDGERGGVVRVRAKISKIDNKTLCISEIPYGKTTSSLIDSILKAVEKGKIKVRKVDDNTADKVEILVHLAPGASSDKTLDALYAFTDCEVNISPNCCVIEDKKPHFLSVGTVLRKSVDHTLGLLRRELEIQRDETLETLHFASLEKIFIEERIYKDRGFEQAENMDAACAHIDERLTPFYPQMVREVTKDDILRLMEIKMARILKFNKDKADENIARLKADIEETENHLAHITDYTIAWFRRLKEKYGAQFPRRTEIRNFDTIVATKVAEANEKLYINREEGFIGTGLKKDEFVCERQAYYLQRHLPRRERRIPLHQAFQRDFDDTRPRVRRDARHTGFAHRLLHRQPQRRGGNRESDPAPQPAHQETGVRARLQHHQHQGTPVDGQLAHQVRGTQNRAETTRRLYPGRTQGVVRPRCVTPQLRRARTILRRVPKR